MNAFLKNSILALFIVFFSSTAFAFGSPEASLDYDKRPLTIGFFNGMKNTEEAAQNNLDKLKEFISSSDKIHDYAKPSIDDSYELFYNT